MYPVSLIFSNLFVKFCPSGSETDTQSKRMRPSNNKNDWVNITDSSKSNGTTPERTTVRETAVHTSATLSPRSSPTGKSPSVSSLEYSFIYLTDVRISDELKHTKYKPQFFSEPLECSSALISAVGQRLIIIVSQSLSEEFIPLVHDLVQVIYIYILHKYDSYRENEDDSYINDKRYPKIRGSFIEHAMLMATLNSDLKQLSNMCAESSCLCSDTSFNFYLISQYPPSLKSLADEEYDFVLSQLVLNTILKCDVRNSLTDIVMSTNQDGGKRLWNRHREFHQKYVPEKAINYYLTEVSLQNELTTSFHTKNLQKIYEWWYFIHDLLKQLRGGKKSITLHHGQFLMADKIEEIKAHVGGFLVSSSFISMSTSNARQMCYSRNKSSHSHLEHVFFQFTIKSRSTQTRFSMVAHSKEEETYLFAPGSIFRIESIEKISNQSWLCKLHISNEDEIELAQTFQRYAVETGTELTYLSFGKYLQKMGQAALGIEYLEDLRRACSDPDTISTIRNNILIISNDEMVPAAAKNNLGGVAESPTLNTQEESVINVPLLTPTVDIVLANPVYESSPIMNHYNLACAYRQAQNYEQALKECNEAINLNTSTSDSGHTALLYGAMASVYYSQKNYADALKYFKMASDKASLYFPSTDSLVYQYQNNVKILNSNIDLARSQTKFAS